MKTIKCPDCEVQFEGETPMDVLNKMHPHYMEVHKDIISNATPEQKEVWMKNFNTAWEAA